MCHQGMGVHCTKRCHLHIWRFARLVVCVVGMARGRRRTLCSSHPPAPLVPCSPVMPPVAAAAMADAAMRVAHIEDKLGPVPLSVLNFRDRAPLVC